MPAQNRFIKVNDNTYPISVLIPDAEDWQTVKVLRCLGQISTVSAHILSKKQKPLSRFSRFCKSYHHNPGKNESDWIKEINSLVEKLRINVILPVSLKGVVFISKSRKDISDFASVAPLADPEIIALANDKWAFHKFISREHLPSIPTLYIGNTGDNILSENLDSIEFPALLKPASEAGGFGIVKAANASELEHAWRDKRIMKNRHYILQSYIPGIDICLQVFCKSGRILAYTVQKSLCKSNGDYYGPQRIMEFVLDEDILALGKKIISLMNWNGIACIDFRIDARDGKIKTLELNPRFGQAMLGSLTAGVNFPILACYSAMNMDYPVAYRNTKYAHPTASVKVLVSSILKKKSLSTKLRWRESGLKYTCNDPMPEIVDFMNRTVSRFKRKTRHKQSLCNLSGQKLSSNLK